MMIPPPVSVPTGNYAGYQWHGGNVSAAEFTVPAFPYHDMNAEEKAGTTSLSLWTALTNGPDIEQIGIYSYIKAKQVSWAGVCAWWPVVAEGCGHGISTGDKIFVSVHRSGFHYVMAMHDAGPHNVWTVSISRTLPHADSTGEFIAEDSHYPHTPAVNLTHFDPIKVATSGNPATEYYSAWGHAIRNTSRSFTIKHS
jgi:hypothetical protein